MLVGERLGAFGALVVAQLKPGVALWWRAMMTVLNVSLQMLKASIRFVAPLLHLALERPFPRVNQQVSLEPVAAGLFFQHLSSNSGPIFAL